MPDVGRLRRADGRRWRLSCSLCLLSDDSKERNSPRALRTSLRAAKYRCRRTSVPGTGKKSRCGASCVRTPDFVPSPVTRVVRETSPGFSVDTNVSTLKPGPFRLWTLELRECRPPQILLRLRIRTSLTLTYIIYEELCDKIL